MMEGAGTQQTAETLIIVEDMDQLLSSALYRRHRTIHPEMVRSRPTFRARTLLSRREEPNEDAVTAITGNPKRDASSASKVLRVPAWRGMIGAAVMAISMAWSMGTSAAETINAYSIWPENWARPILEEFETTTGIKVNFLRFSSGEALARVIAEKNNPKVDVLFGGPVETFAAGIKEGVFEPYKPPASAVLPARFRHVDGYWTAIADDPLVFMTSKRFLAENKLEPPASWDDLLNPAYKGMLQMADARTSGTAVTRIFSILEVYGRDEDKAFAYMKKLRANVQVYTKSGGGGTLPVGLGQPGGGSFFLCEG